MSEEKLSRSESSSECEDDVFENYLAEIAAENFGSFFATAKEMRKDGDLHSAILLLRALIVRGGEIFDSELNINLADLYFWLGDVWLEQLEMSGEGLVAQQNSAENEQKAIMNDIKENSGQPPLEEKKEEEEENELEDV